MSAIADKGGVNEQEEIMEKLNEKGMSGIKEYRIQTLRGKYIKPDISEFASHENNINGNCSDMASSCTTNFQSCTNDFGNGCTNMA